MNLKLSVIWYWTANVLILAMVWISMYLNNSWPLLAVAVPLILLDRAYVVPILITIAAIEGSFKVEDAASQAESTAILLVFPFFIYDYITNNKVKIPFKLSLLYIFFGFFVILGMYIYSMHPQIKQYLAPLMTQMPKGVVGLIIKMVMKFLKIVFFFMFLKILINKDRELISRSLNLLKDLTPFVIGMVLLNMTLYGVVTEKFQTMHFGDSHHGDFSANMNALGVFLYIGLLEKKTSFFKRLINLGGLACLLIIIMNLASRNGLLCFCILGVLAGGLGIWNKNWGTKFSIIITALFVVAICAYIFKDSPTVERFIYQTTEEGGGDRLSYWSAGLQSLKEDPLFGLGGDETSALYAVGRYSPWVEDHVMHNTFIEFAVEYGILGFIFYCIFQYVILYHAYKNFMFAVTYNKILLAAPSISYFLSIFAGLFVSRVWESTLWYNMTLIFAIYILYRMPIEIAIKKRKKYAIYGMPDPLQNAMQLLPTNV